MVINIDNWTQTFTSGILLPFQLRDDNNFKAILFEILFYWILYYFRISLTIFRFIRFKRWF